MKTLVQKLPLEKDSSFIARTYQTPSFETPYHHHLEYELMVIKKGNGTAFIGDYIGEYQVGDTYLIGNNIPHWFRKKNNNMIGASMVVQFREDFLGKDFLDIPEMSNIKNLLTNSSKGIQLQGVLKKRIGRKLYQLESQTCYQKVITLLNLLNDISQSDEYIYVSGLKEVDCSVNDQFLINLIFEFSMQNFKRKITLEEVALLTNKSISAFCHYFKKTTKMCYITYLTQIRIDHACKLLKNTNLSVTQICYESGFYNWANFSKHFKEHCKVSPMQYRTNFRKKSNISER